MLQIEKQCGLNRYVVTIQPVGPGLPNCYLRSDCKLVYTRHQRVTRTISLCMPRFILHGTPLGSYEYATSLSYVVTTGLLSRP